MSAIENRSQEASINLLWEYICYTSRKKQLRNSLRCFWCICRCCWCICVVADVFVDVVDVGDVVDVNVVDVCVGVVEVVVDVIYLMNFIGGELGSVAKNYPDPKPPFFA